MHYRPGRSLVVPVGVLGARDMRDFEGGGLRRMAAAAAVAADAAVAFLLMVRSRQAVVVRMAGVASLEAGRMSLGCMRAVERDCRTVVGSSFGRRGSADVVDRRTEVSGLDSDHSFAEAGAGGIAYVRCRWVGTKLEALLQCILLWACYVANSQNSLPVINISCQHSIHHDLFGSEHQHTEPD